MSEIILHSSKCPRCVVLETKLKQKGIEYIENNDVNVMVAKGMRSAPALEVDGRMLGYVDAVKWVNDYNKG